MATNTALRPIRDWNEHDTINFFGVSGGLVTQGTFVVVVGSGLNLEDPMTFTNDSWLPTVQSARFNVPNYTAPAPANTPARLIVGMTKKTQQVVDENGLPLKFFPQKADILDVVIPGQAVPIISEGDFMYSGISGVVSGGASLAVSDAGDGSLKVLTNPSGNEQYIVAQALGPVNAYGYAYIRLKL